MASLVASSAAATGTAVSLEDSYKDVTEWYASRTTVNDASSFRVLAISLLVLVRVVRGERIKKLRAEAEVGDR